MLGYFLGGRAIDRYGTRGVFFFCHMAFGAILFFFLFRDCYGMPLIAGLAAAHFLYGLPLAVSSIALSTEMMALAPERGRSVATSLCFALGLAGASLSGVLVGWGVRMGIFSQQWTLVGQPRSEFDAAFLIYAVLIITMTITLGLVPSVLGKATDDGNTAR